MGSSPGDGRFPVFIVGMERSGTSLLRSILNGSSALAIAPETHFINRWMGRWGDRDPGNAEVFEGFWRDFSTSQHFSKLGLDPDEVGPLLRGRGVSWRDVHASLLAAFASSQGKERLGEKVPAYFRHLDRLFDWYPDARVIYSVRDPRAVVASHRMLDESWASVSDFELVRRWRERATMAVRWSTHPQVKIVRYEDLIADQRGTLASLCRFVEVPIEVAMLTRPRAVSRGTGPLEPGAAVVSSQVDAWRRRLSTSDAQMIAYATRRQAAGLGYDSETEIGGAIRLRLGFEAAQWGVRASWRRLRRRAAR